MVPWTNPVPKCAILWVVMNINLACVVFSSLEISSRLLSLTWTVLLMQLTHRDGVQPLIHVDDPC